MIEWMDRSEYLRITDGNERIAKKRKEALYVDGKFFAHYMQGKPPNRKIIPFSCDTKEEVDMMLNALVDESVPKPKMNYIQDMVKVNNRKCKLEMI
jgi:hypothetical protein